MQVNIKQSEVRILLPLLGGMCFFDYTIPAGLVTAIGDFVAVSFRKKESVGVVWEFVESTIPKNKLKPITSKYDLPSLTNKHLKLIQFIADYTMSSYGAVLKMMIPQQGSFKLSATMPAQYQPLNMTTEFTTQQQAAITQMKEESSKGYTVTLLDGVTGSGKTEVYFALIDQMLQQADKQALVLLPEIMLTTQLIKRVEKRFGFTPATWHSGMTPAQKRHLWLDILTGKQRLVVGARSALFLPYKNLSLIVVDEEHDASYKQEDGVVYNARDAAVACGYIYKIPVILSSATPAMETLLNVKLGKYKHVSLPSRYGAASLPTIEIVDMRKENLSKSTWLSRSLIEATKTAIASNQQVMLFLNRRGYAPITLCKSCGYKYTCPNCSAHLVSHKEDGVLICHHCGYNHAWNNKCKDCGQEDSLMKCGPGVERIAEEVERILPQARIQLITKDTVQDMESAQKIVDRILQKEVDIIIGTQMISKGHDFPAIAVVGIVDADLGLGSADLRSAEKTYHLLTQMSGRAGRRESGKAIIQTYYPESPILASLVAGNRDEFTDYEMQSRKMLEMPPFGKLAAIILSGTQEAKLHDFAKSMLRISPNAKGVMVLGPVKAPLAKIRNRHRYRFLIKANSEVSIQKYLSYWLGLIKIPASIRVKVDIDPYNFL